LAPVETRNILLVEDEPLIALAEKKRLERFGYAVATVGSGEKAIESINGETKFDLILMDIDLGGGIDGTQAAEAILKERDIPIVFLSSHTDPEVVGKTEKITSYGYVVKSSSMTVLDASIKMAFKLFAARMEAKQRDESLRASEEKYRLQFMHMNSYNSMYETVRDDAGEPCDFRFVMVNDAYVEFVGKSASQLVGRTILEVFPRTEQYWIDAMVATVTTGEPRTFENYSTELDTWIEVNLFTPQPDRLVMTSTNVTERKRIEQEWRESTVRYEELISRVTAGIYVVRVLPDGETEFEFVSDRWCVIHGVQREAVLANAAAVTDLVHPEDHESFIARNRDALRDQQPFEWEGRFYTGNGRLLWLHMESTPVVRETGEIRWYGVVHDITESKRVETELALQKEYLEAVLETTSDGFWIIDGNKRISRVNPAACRISGYDKDELENLQINDIDAIESPARVDGAAPADHDSWFGDV
jgi:PAS domain S-box-containing protein